MDDLFVYLGEDEIIGKEVEKYSTLLNRAYASLLTPEQQEKVCESNKRVLRASSFFHEPKDLARDVGFRPSPRTPDKYGLVGVKTPDNEEMLCAPFFYVSANNFPYGGSSQFTDKVIASYVHEFDHYILQALQRIPINAIHDEIHEFLDVRQIRFNVKDYLSQLGSMPFNAQQKTERALLATYDPMITEIFEKATRILDARVLNSIGVRAPLQFRDRPTRYCGLIVPGSEKRIATLDENTDPFYRISDKEVIRRISMWETSPIVPHVMTPEIKRFIEKARTKKYRRVSLEFLLDKIHRHNSSKLVEQEGSGI